MALACCPVLLCDALLTSTPTSTPTLLHRLPDTPPKPLLVGGGDDVRLAAAAPTMVPPLCERTLGGDDDRERREYQLNVGRCVDALRRDLPELFERELQDDIYTANIELRDPSGVQLRGKTAYRQVFGMLRLFRRIAAARVDVSLRLRHNELQERIEVRWHSHFTSRHMSLYVDCISHYYLSPEGLVHRHHVEKIDVNSQTLKPPYGQSWLNLQAHLLGALEPCPAGLAFFKDDEPSPDDDLDVASGDVLAPSSPVLNNVLTTTANSVLPETCENVWDCESPLSCCDFGFFKVCCGNGVPAFAPIPIPVPVEPYPPRRQDF